MVWRLNPRSPSRYLRKYDSVSVNSGLPVFLFLIVNLPGDTASRSGGLPCSKVLESSADMFPSRAPPRGPYRQTTMATEHSRRRLCDPKLLVDLGRTRVGDRSGAARPSRGEVSGRVGAKAH